MRPALLNVWQQALTQLRRWECRRNAQRTSAKPSRMPGWSWPSTTLQDTKCISTALLEGLENVTAKGLAAQVHSIASQGVSAWLDTLPAAYRLTLLDGDFQAALRRPLGLHCLRLGASIVTCFCGAPLACTGSEHAHMCPDVVNTCVLRHDNISVLRRTLCVWHRQKSRSLKPSTTLPRPCRQAILKLVGTSSLSWAASRMTILVARSRWLQSARLLQFHLYVILSKCD
jgi:hypothetical protein